MSVLFVAGAAAAARVDRVAMAVVVGRVAGIVLSRPVFHQSRFFFTRTRTITLTTTIAARCFATNVKPSLSTMAEPLKIVNNITKSEQDNRDYRGLVLQNGMRVMLISDPTTDKSAAAMDVNVGWMSDPDQLPGLAHFCEHMLFLGTEKYPQENEYGKYLSEHSGFSNAFTAPDHTNFYFDVAPDAFQGALDRFAQFFLKPLFTEAMTDREVNAVNSEHEKNIQSDLWRLSQLEQTVADPSHPYHKFGTGSKSTLDAIPKSKNIVVRDALLAFHTQWYSSNIMSLVLLGKESLDELQSVVLKLFDEVENKNVTANEWTRHPYGEAQLKQRDYVFPVKDLRTLTLLFPIPDLLSYYKTQPGHYVAHLIGHEGPGSLLSTLKNKGWVNSLSAGPKEGARGFQFFIVSVNLTEEGINCVEDIITHIFEYIQLLKDCGPQQWIFDECKDLRVMTFRFKDKEQPQSYVSSLAMILHDYPLDEVLAVYYLYTEYKPELITMVQNHLTPDNMRYTAVGKKYEPDVNLTDDWYGTRYTTQPIPEEFIEKWRNPEQNPELHLPPTNEFIPSNFELKAREKDKQELPTLIKDTPLTRLWYKQDNTFLLPKGMIHVELSSPFAYLDPLHCNLIYMLARLMQDSLNEYTYSAALAGLSYSLANSKYGLMLTIGGYDDKQKVLLEKVIEKLTTFKVDPKRFEIIKETYVRSLRNFYMEQPYTQAMYYLSLLVTERAWTKDELLIACEEMTPELLQNFIDSLLSKMHIEALVHGNYVQQEALDMIAVIEKSLQSEKNTKPLLPQQQIRDREIQLTPSVPYVYERENSIHSSSCVQNYYQCGIQQTRANVLLDLFCQVINEPCYSVLRTREQLGYVVASGVRRANGVHGFQVLIQSERHPQYLDQRIEAFLHSVQELLDTMTEEEFQRHVEALAAIRLEKPKRLATESMRHWNEIVAQHYMFDRNVIEVEELRKLTKKDLLDFYKDLVIHDSESRRKLSIQVLSTAGEIPTPPTDTKKVIDGLNLPPPLPPSVIIEDVTTFKSGLALYPLVKPYVHIHHHSVSTKSKL